MDSSNNSHQPPADQPTGSTASTACPCLPGKGRQECRFLYFCAVFVLGVSIGLLAGILGFRYYLFSFRPQPEEFAQDISTRIADDFNLPDETRQKIIDIIRSNHPRIQEAVEESFRSIEKIKLDVAGKVADLLTDPRDRQRWLAEYDRYFPKPPRPDHPGEGPGGPFPDDGPHGPPPHKPDFPGGEHPRH